jgi:hypothetical protein
MTNTLRIIAATAAFSPFWLAAQQPASLAPPGSDSAIMVRMGRPQAQTGPVTGKPFSATEVRRTVQTLADGSHVDQSDSSEFARDERGRMRSGNANTVMIFDPVAGFTYTLDARSKTYTKTALSGDEATYTISVAGSRTSISSTSVDRPSSTRPAPSEEELPAQVISGTLAKGSRVTTTIPSGTFGNNRDLKVVNERWYSDDLQVLLKSSNTDPRFGTTTYELTNFVPATPDPGLFQVPADYRLRTANGHDE